MSLHNVLALKAARSLVHLIHAGGDWRQVFSGSNVALGYVRSGAAWPVPDAVLIDGEEEQSASFCALEFKPPRSAKSECVRGLGQAVTYLAQYDSAALILPDRAQGGYDIARHIAGLISTPASAHERIGVYAYSVATASPTLEGSLRLTLLKPVGGHGEQLRVEPRPQLERTFWAFWRDTSLQEFFLVLDRADRIAGEDDVKNRSLVHAYDQYAALQTVNPQNRKRGTAGISERDFKAHTAVTISHLGLWEEDATLTSAGRHLVHLGRLFGPKSAPFRDAFARSALLAGRHYEFIKLVYEFQRDNPGRYDTANAFTESLEAHLEDSGLLRRLPKRRTTGSRRFFKAELTFWGVMLGIIRKRGPSYVVPGVGLDFDWPRILDLLAAESGEGTPDG